MGGLPSKNVGVTCMRTSKNTFNILWVWINSFTQLVLFFHIFTFYRWCCFSLIFTKQEFFERKRQQKNNVRSTAPREVKKIKAGSQDLFSLEVIMSAHRSAEKTGGNTAWIADNFVDSSWWPISVPRKMTDCFSYTAPPLFCTPIYAICTV